MIQKLEMREAFVAGLARRDADLSTDWPLAERDRLPLLVTGISGVAGYNIFHLLAAKYPGQIYGQRPSSTWRLVGPNIIAGDLDDRAAMQPAISKLGIRSVLHCGGNCALKSCELDPAMAHRVNVDSLDSLLDAIEGQNVRIVSLSVDLVYSGIGSGGYLEHDPVDPVTVYGKTMVLAEQLLQHRRPDACIFRISLPMGISFNGHAGAIDWIKSRFAAGRPATLYYDEVRTPTYVQCMSSLFEAALASDVAGLFHAGGPRRLSLFQIAQIINRVGGYDPSLLHGCFRIEAGPMPPRAGNVSMNSSALGTHFGQSLRPWPLNESLIPDSQHWHWDRSETGSYDRITRMLYQHCGTRAGCQR